MAVMENGWQRKSYENWDDAFRGLAPAIRHQSVRVAAYSQVLYVQACAAKFGADIRSSAERMQGNMRILRINADYITSWAKHWFRRNIRCG